MTILYAGSKAPLGVEVKINSLVQVDGAWKQVLDLATVTSASFDVTRPNGTTTTWTATIDEATRTSTYMRLTHVYNADGTDVALVGAYVLTTKLTVGGAAPGTVPSSNVYVVTVDPHL